MATLQTRMLVMVATCLALTCTDAGLIAVGANGVAGPDRAEFQGEVCVQLAQGDSFPVKMLFAVEGGVDLDPSVAAAISEAVDRFSTEHSSPNISMALTTHHTFSLGLAGSFSKEPLPMNKYTAEASRAAGPVSHRSALKLAESIITGDMQTACRGQVARTRYVVVLIMVNKDVSCAYPAFNPDVATNCRRLTDLPNAPACTACELGRTTEELKALARRYNAGQIQVQPVVLRAPGDTDQDVRIQAASIASAGGTAPIEATAENIATQLALINTSSLQTGLRLKRLIALNRNLQVRGGEVLVDSDGDSLPDIDEKDLGTDPQNPDSDGDLLSDGVEARAGMRPQKVEGDINRDKLNGCVPDSDQDQDRLNDCEERVLGTDACIGDTDGDGLPDLVEFYNGTNPLIAEELADDDRDGLSNIGEVLAKSDPASSDLAFQQERGIGYAIEEVEPTKDGRACYSLDIYNVGLVETLKRVRGDGTNRIVPAGRNDVFIYFQVGRENDPAGTGIGSLYYKAIDYTVAKGRTPRGIIQFTDSEFAAGY